MNGLRDQIGSGLARLYCRGTIHRFQLPPYRTQRADSRHCAHLSTSQKRVMRPIQLRGLIAGPDAHGSL